jgi:hypothetical protein
LAQTIADSMTQSAAIAFVRRQIDREPHLLLPADTRRKRPDSSTVADD